MITIYNCKNKLNQTL